MYKEHFQQVESIINQGIFPEPKTREDVAKRIDSITKEILEKVDMNANKARFWAINQLSNFLSENEILRARKAGRVYYYWRNNGARTRPTHLENFGKVFSIDADALNLSKTGTRHPIQDYRCDCSMEWLSERDIEQESKKGKLPGQKANPVKSVEQVANSYGLFDRVVEAVKNFVKPIFQSAGKDKWINGTAEEIARANKKIKILKEANETLEKQEYYISNLAVEFAIIKMADGKYEYVVGGKNYVNVSELNGQLAEQYLAIIIPLVL